MKLQIISCLLSIILFFAPSAFGGFSVSDSISNTATAKLLSPGSPGYNKYLVGLTVAHATLGAATELCIRSVPIASTTATLSSNTLVMAADYGWQVGDLVYVTASTVTGLTAANYYYIFSKSGNNLQFTAARGSTVATISGSSVAATLSKILFRSQLQTTALPLINAISYGEPKGGIGLGIEAVTVTAVTGLVYLNTYLEERN
jgi:hypothetical protein